MYSLAICDDNALEAEKVNEYVLKFNKTQKLESSFQTEVYTNPRVLLDDVMDGKAFDVFLLDIEMEPLNGLKLAEHLRLVIASAPIIFLSSHTDTAYLQQGYKVRALRYVTKMTMESSLSEALSAVINDQTKTETRYLTITHYKQPLRVPHDEIMYVHRVSRITELVLSDSPRIPLRISLKGLYAEIGSERFLYIDKSCFVNIEYILKIESGMAVLNNGDSLAVSRKMLPQVKSITTKLWGGVT